MQCLQKGEIMLNFSTNFVCASRERATFNKQFPSPVFRRSFTLESVPAYAEILISGIGFYDLYVNGKKITKGIIAPYISNTDDIVYYDLYDLVPYLNAGENVIGVICGNGFNDPLTKTWDFNKAKHASSPKLALTFKATGEHYELCFDAGSFKCKESEILFDNMRTGVFVDARLADKGRFEPGFDDSDWRSVIPAEMPRGKAKLCECEPDIVHFERKPVEVCRGEFDDAKDYNGAIGDFGLTELGQVRPKDGYIYDFGYNDSGIFRLKVNGRPGQKIDIYTSELREGNKLNGGNISTFLVPGYFQHCSYICKGGVEEIFEPQFSYFAFRYAYVTGITEEQAKPELLTFLVAHSDLESRGGFECSDADANALYEIAERSDLSNFNYFPTDCPHREKNGWTGDASMSSEHMILTLGVEKSWREWLHNIRAAQNYRGELPGIVPTAGWGFAWGNGPTWDSVLFNLPWYIYIYRGETDVILENAHTMMRYLEYISRRRDERGLVGIGLGDWVPTGGANAYTYDTPIEFTDSVMVYDMAAKAEKMFNAVGLTLNASFARALADEMRTAVRRELIDLDSMLVDGNTITAQAMAIYYNILEPGEKKAAFEHMLTMIRAQGDGFIGVGMIGLRTMFHVLSDFGESELAYKLITRREFPSYGCLLDRGETTLPEQLMPEGRDCGSHDHHFLGDYKQWYIRQVAGIVINPSENNADSAVIRPHFISTLDYASAYHVLPHGKLEVKWTRIGKDTVSLHVKHDKGVKVHISLTPECMITDGYPRPDGKYPTCGEYNLKIKLYNK